MNKEDIVILLRAHRRVGNFDKMLEYLYNAGELEDFHFTGDLKECVLTWLYPTWINSEAWKRIRKKKLMDENLQCEMCGTAKNLQVHHITYEHLLVEDMFPDDLVVLCKNCHENVHAFDIVQKKREEEKRKEERRKNDISASMTEEERDMYEQYKMMQLRIRCLSTSDKPDELIEMIELKKRSSSLWGDLLRKVKDRKEREGSDMT